jgi:hypothetical protein
MRLTRVYIFLMIIAFASCRKSEEITYDPDVKLSFSRTKIVFDTVFTSVGSTHRQIKIYNKNAKAVVVSSIKLANGGNSPFSLIINGQTLNSQSDLQLDGRDSISIYAKVTINPTSASLPFIVEDSIVFLTNGNTQAIPLAAYGQNANFINEETITGNKTWSKVLPYVVYKSLTIAENATLNIAAGATVLFHSNAAMNIKGTLNASGTKNEPIIFAGDRLERLYEEEAGQWTGLHFYNKSKSSTINYAVLKNAIVGITTDSLSLNDQPKLILSNTVVKNMVIAGFVGYGAELSAFNNLIYNCGQYLLYGVGGGKYDLKQNTFAAYNLEFPRKTAAVYLSDFRNSSQQGTLKLEMTNNIIWGSLTDELLIDLKTNLGFIGTIKNNLIRTTRAEFNKDGNVLNTDPLFIQSSTHNYLLRAASPAANKGLDLSGDHYYSTILSRDLQGLSRLFPSELGCYENN